MYLDLRTGDWKSIKDFKTTSGDYQIIGMTGRTTPSALKGYIKKFELKPDSFEIVDADKLRKKL